MAGSRRAARGGAPGMGMRHLSSNQLEVQHELPRVPGRNANAAEVAVFAVPLL